MDIPDRLNITAKEFTAFKEHFKLNQCFYPGCSEKAIKAHSIQEAGPLAVISDTVKSQKKQVYYLDDDLRYIPEIDAIGKIHKERGELKCRGIGEASTFTGFCEKHDTIFKETIEDVPFKGTDEQCFLFSYRAFAHSMHQASAGFKGASAVNEMSLDLLKEIQDIPEPEGVKETQNEFAKQLWETVEKIKETAGETVHGLLEGVNKVMKVGLTERDLVRKKELDRIVTSSSHADLTYCVRKFDGILPVAAASVISYLDDQFMARSGDGISYSAYYALTVLPENRSGQTYFIIGALNENPNVALQMTRFKSMKTSEFLKMMSNLLIFSGHNTYLSPRLVHKLSDRAMNELIRNRILAREHNGEIGVPDCPVSLFDKTFLE